MILDQVMVPALVGDVLRVGVVGQFDCAVMRQVLEGATRRRPDFGALLLDLTLAVVPLGKPVGDGQALAALWRAELPRLPCVVLCSALVRERALRLALLLAASEHPISMSVFEPLDRAAAWRCGNEFAATYRFEEARRRR